MSLTRALTLSLAAGFLIAGPSAWNRSVRHSAPEASWLARIQDRIRADEAAATLQDADALGRRFDRPRWHLVNRAGGLRAYADERGIEFSPRATGGRDWRIRFGMDGSPVQSTSAEGARVVLHRG